jgi:hypothetical protein
MNWYNNGLKRLKKIGRVLSALKQAVYQISPILFLFFRNNVLKSTSKHSSKTKILNLRDSTTSQCSYDLLLEVHPDLENLRASCEQLTPYAVGFRYPGEEATIEDAEMAIQLAQKIRNVIRDKLKT